MAEAGSTTLDVDFVQTKYGLLRIAQGAGALVCLIVIASIRCWGGNPNFYEFVSSWALIFSVLTVIVFVSRFHEVLERCINLPLTLLVNESVISVLFAIAGVLVLFSSCYNAGSKVGAIIAGMLAIVDSVLFGYSARMSYEWFTSGSFPG